MPLAQGLRQQFALSVQSDQPLVAERSLVAQDTLAGLGPISGATSEAGAVAPATSWLFAEGYTGSGFQEYLELANFAPASAAATIKLVYDNGHSQTFEVPVLPLGRSAFNVNQANTARNGQCDSSPCQTTPMFSTEITSVMPIVAERLMYFSYGPQKLPGISTTLGEPGWVAHSVYTFASGCTGNPLSESLALYNPTGEHGIHPLDPDLGIAWPAEAPQLSDRDAAAPTLAEAEAGGLLPDHGQCRKYVDGLR